jgi:hypothetical protein
LLDALQVSPLARWDAKALQTRHSLLAGTAGTIDMHQLRDDLHVHGEKITKAIALEISTSTQVVVEQIRISEKRIMYESAVNFDQLHNTLISFREEVLMGFSTLGESLLQVAAQAALGNAQLELQLSTLRRALEQQRQVGTIDTRALEDIFTGFGEDISQKMNASVTQILSQSATMGTSQIANNNEMVKKVDLLLSMMTKMEGDINVIRSQNEKLMNLMKQVEARSNDFPRTFIIKPRYAPDESSSSSAAAKPTSSSMIGRLANKVSNLVSKVNVKVRSFLWDESFLLFICPVKMKEVPCGPDGNGFLIQIPTETLKTIVPILKYGMLFAKAFKSCSGWSSDSHFESYRL